MDKEYLSHFYDLHLNWLINSIMHRYFSGEDSQPIAQQSYKTKADSSSKGTNNKIEAKISTKRSSERSQRLFLHFITPPWSYFFSIIGMVF